MTDVAVRLIKYLFFCVSIYLIIFVFTFIVVVLAELYKENKRRGSGKD